MLFGSVPLTLLALLVRGEAPDWSGSFVWSLAFTLVITTCVGSFLWLYVLRELPAGIAGLGTMGTPVVGVLSSWGQLGETPTTFEVVGMVVILAGLGILFGRGIRSVSPVAGSAGPPPPSRRTPRRD